MKPYLQTYKRGNIKRISPTLRKLLCEEDDVEFLEYMCFHPNRNIRLMVLRNNKNIPLYIAEDYICFGESTKNLFFKHYSNEIYNENIERSINRVFREELLQFLAINIKKNLPISTLIKSAKIDDFDRWSRCRELSMELVGKYKYLTSCLNIPYTECWKKDRKDMVAEPSITRLVAYK
jgi:hypothetical protein